MMKVPQKISGTFRSMTGAEVFARIRGDISTLKKQGVPMMEYLQQAIPRGALSRTHSPVGRPSPCRAFN